MLFNNARKLKMLGKWDEKAQKSYRDTAMNRLEVDGDQYDQTMQQSGLMAKPTAAVDPASSMAAAQKVMYNRQFGSGLDTQAAMQDPNYQLGSGSALRQPARSLEKASGAMNRQARALKRKGYMAQAGEMAGMAAQAKLNEPSITRQSDLKQQTDTRMAQADLMGQEQDMMNRTRDYMNRLLEKRGHLLDGMDDDEVDQTNPNPEDPKKPKIPSANPQRGLRTGNFSR
jgi:hypothetical protein